MVGELIVAHEITQAAAVTNLKRIIAVCGGRLVTIITPFPRYINGKCCDAGDHCTHLAVPESGDKIFDDLRRIQLSAVPKCQVVAAGHLLLNKKKKAMAEIMEAYSNSWGTVHAATRPPTRGWRWASLTYSPPTTASHCPASRRYALLQRLCLLFEQHPSHLRPSFPLQQQK
jgi:hypothetical protein